jgi:hypothetical protein
MDRSDHITHRQAGRRSLSKLAERLGQDGHRRYRPNRLATSKRIGNSLAAPRQCPVAHHFDESPRQRRQSGGDGSIVVLRGSEGGVVALKGSGDGWKEKVSNPAGTSAMAIAAIYGRWPVPAW